MYREAFGESDAINLVINYVIKKQPHFKTVGYNLLALGNASKETDCWIVQFDPPGPVGKWTVDRRTRIVTELKGKMKEVVYLHREVYDESDAINLVLDYLMKKQPHFSTVGYDPAKVAKVKKDNGRWIVQFDPPGPVGKWVVWAVDRRKYIVTELKEKKKKE